MSNAVDHIGILVGDLDAAVDHYRDLFRVPGQDVVVERGYRNELSTGRVQVLDVAFVKTANVYVNQLSDPSRSRTSPRAGPELLQPASDGPIRDLHSMRGNSVHHVAMRCADVRPEWRRPDERRAEFGLLDSIQNRCPCSFLHPERNVGVLIEPDAAWVRTHVADFTQIGSGDPPPTAMEQDRRTSLLQRL